MASITKLPSGSFRAQIRRRGLVDDSATFKTEEEAKRWSRAREAELLVTHNIAVPKLSENLLFSAVVERYFASPVFANKAKGTQARERSNSIRVLKYFGSYAISAIDSMMVQEFLDLRSTEKAKRGNGVVLDRPVSGDAVRLDKAFISAIFGFAKGRKLVPVNIMKDSFDIPTCNEREGRITLEQQLKLFNAAQSRATSNTTNKSLLPWLTFVFETGTRPGEAAKAEISWFDLKNRKVAIPRVGQKKRNPRVVIIRTELAELLEECVKTAREVGSKYIFWSRAKERLVKDENGVAIRRRRTAEETARRKIIPFSYYPVWRDLCKEAGVPTDVNPHTIRHEFISRLYENTAMNDGQIAALVGDVNVLSLARYRHLLVERLRDKQDAHLDELESAMTVLQQEQDRVLRENFADIQMRRQESIRESGDTRTPLQRIHDSYQAQLDFDAELRHKNKK